jgi:hypothetical protein
LFFLCRSLIPTLIRFGVGILASRCAGQLSVLLVAGWLSVWISLCPYHSFRLPHSTDFVPAWIFAVSVFVCVFWSPREGLHPLLILFHRQQSDFGPECAVLRLSFQASCSLLACVIEFISLCLSGSVVFRIFLCWIWFIHTSVFGLHFSRSLVSSHSGIWLPRRSTGLSFSKLMFVCGSLKICVRIVAGCFRYDS